jgi:hypothetical protein
MGAAYVHTCPSQKLPHKELREDVSWILWGLRTFYFCSFSWDEIWWCSRRIFSGGTNCPNRQIAKATCRDSRGANICPGSNLTLSRHQVGCDRALVCELSPKSIKRLPSFWGKCTLMLRKKPGEPASARWRWGGVLISRTDPMIKLKAKWCSKWIAVDINIMAQNSA